MCPKLIRTSTSDNGEYVIINLEKDDKVKGLNSQLNMQTRNDHRIIEHLKAEQEQLKLEIKKLKEQNAFILNEIKIENEIVLKKLDEFMNLNKLSNLKIYQNLPIPRLTTRMNVKNWFSFYKKVMNVDDDKVLIACLGYYLSEEAANIFSKCKNFENLSSIELELSEKLLIELYSSH